jgi:hypothetical protein
LAADLLNADSSSLKHPAPSVPEEKLESADEFRTRVSIAVGEVYSPQELK